MSSAALRSAGVSAPAYLYLDPKTLPADSDIDSQARPDAAPLLREHALLTTARKLSGLVENPRSGRPALRRDAGKSAVARAPAPRAGERGDAACDTRGPRSVQVRQARDFIEDRLAEERLACRARPLDTPQPHSFSAAPSSARSGSAAPISIAPAHRAGKGAALPIPTAQ